MTVVNDIKKAGVSVESTRRRDLCVGKGKFFFFGSKL